MIHAALSPKLLTLYIYIISIAYINLRGKVRPKALGKWIDHAVFLGPINLLMYLFSKVPTKPFIDLREFPDSAKLRENWQVIRDEARALVEQGYIKASADHDDAGFNSFFNKGWKRFYLKWYEDFLPSAEKLCPKTIEVLKTVSGINGAMFTLLPKRGELTEHRDPFAGSLRYHLGLITPNSDKCRIYVDGVAYHWQDGKDVLFDETYIHSAKNETDMDRIILFCDVARPLKTKLMTQMNRLFCKYIMSGSATKNLETDRVGFINKFYKYYRQLGQSGKQLKRKNKSLYYLFKYTAISGLVYLIFFR